MTASTRVPNLDAVADEAEARWAMHWDVCPTRKNGRDCLRCDQLSAEARQAERNALLRPAVARQARQQTAAAVGA